MKKLSLLSLVGSVFSLVFAMSAFASAQGETCYQLSRSQDRVSRTPELLCVEKADSNLPSPYLLTLRTGLGGERVVATFNYDLIFAARCIDCNKNVFGIANPENSIFNAISITFDGKREFRNGSREEKGTILIGQERFSYRQLQ